MFGKGLQALSKLKDKLDQAIFSQPEHQKQPQNQAIKLTKQECPPFIIDSIEFHLNTLPTVKQANKVKEKIIKHYSNSYLKKFKMNGIEVQIVGEKYFFFVKKSTQIKYNHAVTLQYLRDTPDYQKMLREIHQNQAVLIHFWSIDFSNLKVLNLSGHQLNSLQGMTFMKIPNLQGLQLHNNNLQSIECLSKIHLPKLRILTLYSNKIQRCEKLTRIGSKKLSEWQFDTNNLFEQHRVDLLEFLFKMQGFSKTRKVYMQDEMRIWNEKRMKLFQRQSVTKWKLPESYRVLLRTTWRPERRIQLAEDYNLPRLGD